MTDSTPRRYDEISSVVIPEAIRDDEMLAKAYATGYVFLRDGKAAVEADPVLAPFYRDMVGRRNPIPGADPLLHKRINGYFSSGKSDAYHATTLTADNPDSDRSYREPAQRSGRRGRTQEPRVRTFTRDSQVPGEHDVGGRDLVTIMGEMRRNLCFIPNELRNDVSERED